MKKIILLSLISFLCLASNSQMSFDVSGVYINKDKSLEEGDPCPEKIVIKSNNDFISGTFLSFYYDKPDLVFAYGDKAIFVLNQKDAYSPNAVLEFKFKYNIKDKISKGLIYKESVEADWPACVSAEYIKASN